MATRKGTGSIDELTGTGQSDFLLGTGGDDVLSGGAGNDTLNGGMGADNLHGGMGADNLHGGTGNDRLFGGEGNDYLNGGAADDLLSGGLGNDVELGGSGDDVVNGGTGQDFLIGGSGDDKLVWDPNDFSVNGGVGFDTLSVGGAAVSLVGEINLHDIEAIDMRGRGANSLVADAASVMNATDSHHLLRVFGDRNDALELSGEWNRVRSPVAGFTRYISGAAKVDVDNSVAVTFGNHLSLANLNGINGVHIHGASVLSTNAGDINGDGLDDLLLGAPTSGAGTDAGSAYLLFGKAAGLATGIDLDHLNARQGVHLTGVGTDNLTGTDVSIVGDVNHDGFDDFTVTGGSFNSQIGLGTLQTDIVFGHGGGFPTTFALDQLNADNGYVVNGLPYDDAMGFSVPTSAAGDFNGDGFEDFALGIPTAFVPGGTDAGSAFVVFGAAAPYDKSVDIRVLGPDETWRINGIHSRAGFGANLTSGDINGDGFDDLVVASQLNHEPAYVVFGKATGFDNDLSVASLDGSNGFAVSSQYSGGHVAVADMNGDGFDDVIMQDLTNNAPSVRVVFGHGGAFTATVSAAVLDGNNVFSIAASAKEAPQSISAAGDVNGDGYEDLLIGVPSAIANHQFQAGATYVVFGHGGPFNAQMNLAQMDISQGLRIDGIGKNLLAGFSVSAAGDLNGDGYGDIAISGFGAFDNTGIHSAETYVVYGRDFNHGVAFNGTTGSNTLLGTDNGEALVGGRGNDLLDGKGGSDALIGGANDDTLVWDPTDHRVDGGAGFDTLRFDGFDQTLDLTSLPSKLITGINAIDLTGSGDNHLRLSLQDLLQVSDHAALRVSGNAGDSVEMTTTGWTTLADRSVDGNSYHAYVHGSATLLIDTDITQTIA